METKTTTLLVIGGGPGGYVAAIRAAYQIGEFRITDLLAEQRRLVDSQRELTEALTEQYRALADLDSAMGLPIN